jgi:hypothetical protein
MSRLVSIALSWMVALAMHAEAAAQAPAGDPSVLCERAAREAERDQHLPQGLLAAIGLVESGRSAPARAFPAIWPWTINAEGQAYYLSSKDAAVSMVSALQQRGARIIDVGCFQVDLFYHPYSFVSVADAFDPSTNARVAAHILSVDRLGGAGWDGAIAAYHSRTPQLGAAYLQRVQTVWRWAAAHLSLDTSEPPEAYAPLLSPQARLVRVVTPFDAPAPEPSSGQWQSERASVLWLSKPPADLPRVTSGNASQ